MEKYRIRSGLSAFIEKAKEHPRYRHLINLKDNYRVVSTGLFNAGRYQGVPNFSLTRHLTHLNSLRIARILMSTRDYPSYRFIIAAVMANCLQYEETTTYADYLPFEVRSKKIEAGLARLQEKHRAVEYHDPLRELTELNELLSMELDLDLENLSMVFDLQEAIQRRLYFRSLSDDPFTSGFGGFSNVLSLGLSLLDTELVSLSRDLPREVWYGSGASINGVPHAPFESYAARVERPLCRNLRDRAAEVRKRKRLLIWPRKEPSGH